MSEVVSSKQVDGGPSMLLTCGQVSERLGVTTRHVRSLVSRKELPSPVLLGKRSVRWHEKDIEGYIASLKEKGAR